MLPSPNEYWHIDVTVIRLLDGTRVYLHAAIDNFSRRILAWKAAGSLESANTCVVLIEAGKNLPDDGASATVVADSGVENVNHEVDDVLGLRKLRRVLAQVEVSYSNSVIEAFWRALKHGWLYLNELDTLATVERLVTFYVHQHNAVMPHAAFAGQTPNEVCADAGSALAATLAEGRVHGRQARREANLSITCEARVAESGRASGDAESRAVSQRSRVRTKPSGRT